MVAAVVGLAIGLSSCGGSGGGQLATPRTALIATVQAQYVCEVSGQNFQSEAELQRALAADLEDAGLDLPTWKHWHDSLTTSPARARQLAQASQEADCIAPNTPS